MLLLSPTTKFEKERRTDYRHGRFWPSSAGSQCSDIINFSSFDDASLSSTEFSDYCFGKLVTAIFKAFRRFLS